MPPRDDLTYARIAPSADMAPFARLVHLAFGSSTSDALDWFTNKVGRENIRAVSRDGTPVAALGRVPMGLFLGGRSVPQLGVLGVVVGPESRGGGIAKWMMTECVREMHADGFALSTLYSAMHPLYRSVGYENAGLLCDITIPAGMIDSDDRGSGWRPITDADHAEIEASYADYARDQQGMLDRPPYIWERVRNAREGETSGFVARDDSGAVEAFCYTVMLKWTTAPTTTGSATGAPLKVTDLAWRTPRGMQRLLGFLRGFASICGEITLTAPIGSPLIAALPDWRFATKIRSPWMLRVLDVKKALESRGYAPGVSARIGLEIEDAQVDANTGRWTLTVENASGHLERGGSGPAVRCAVGHLAPLYTGHSTARALRAAGRIEADDAQAAACDAVFAAGPAPCMADMF